jgi:glycerophosphoryl diester phosphodiesterase
VRGERLLTVAHRFGNSAAALREALDAGVDLVEADVHLYRRTLEVRHHKVLTPWLLWDAGHVVPRSRLAVPHLPEILAELHGDSRLLLDLKGVRPDLPARLARTLRERVPGTRLTVCSRHWWMLPPLLPQADGILSAGSPRELARLRRRLASGRAHGVAVRLDLLTAEVVGELGRSTDQVLTWPVDTPPALDRARFLGVDAVISKNLDLLTGLLSTG